MFMLTGRTSIVFDDNGRTTTLFLTQSQGNTNETEFFSSLFNLLSTNSEVYVASIRGANINLDELKNIINNPTLTDNQARYKLFEDYIKRVIVMHDDFIYQTFKIKE